MVKLFGNKLRYLRNQSKMTQAELAARLGPVTQTFVSHLEAGRKEPSVDLALAVADIFSVSLDYLLRDSVPAEAVVDSGPFLPSQHESQPSRDD